jgi:hypothetical protein
MTLLNKTLPHPIHFKHLAEPDSDTLNMTASHSFETPEYTCYSAFEQHLLQKPDNL